MWQEIWQNIQPVLVDLLVLVLLAVLTKLYAIVKDYLVANTSAKLRETVAKSADKIVHFLQQIGDVRGMSNAEKKEWAVNWIIEAVKEIGIYLTYDDADVEIEAAVKRLKIQETASEPQ